MSDSSVLLADLRRIAAGTGAHATISPAMVAGDDWREEGLARAQLHDLHAAEGEDAAAAIGFALALALAAGAVPLLWVRTGGAERRTGRLLAGGIAALGLDPDALMLAVVADEPALLRTAADAARCPGIGTVLIEGWGRMPGLNLTATRRLMLGAEASGVTVLCVRDADPVPSAAASRWRIAAAGSTALPADAPGRPAFDVECLRRRGGPAGGCWPVEWNSDTRCFVPRPAAPAAGSKSPAPAALSGARLPLAVDRAVA